MLADFFKREEANEHYAVVAYYLKNTLSDHGTVNRGVCYQDDNGNLTKVVECTKIARQADGTISYPVEEGAETLEENTLVSMNMWAFKPSYFTYAEDTFTSFIAEHGDELKSEFYIPSLVDDLISGNVLSVRVLDTDSDWFGVTYMDDKPIVMKKLTALIDAKVYPEDLFASN